MNFPAEIKSVIGHRHSRAIMVGVLLLTLIAVLQVLRNKQMQPLIPLVESPHICDADVQRMNLALGRAGISGAKIDNGRLLVPQNKKEASLKAIAEYDAVPEYLREEEQESPSLNPFLSRSQHQRIARVEKKREVRDMVKRLPFVSQAWFEMDSGGSDSMFTATQKSAVISIQPAGELSLDVQQVATVREMIAGAISGLAPDDVVVIDVAEGYAHRGKSESAMQVTPITQRPPFEQEIWYRKRVKHAVASFGDIGVDVQVQVVPVVSKPKLVVRPAAMPKPLQREPSQLPGVIGTNTTASIYQQEVAQPEPEVIPVVANVEVRDQFQSNVAVRLNIPHETAVKFGILKNPGTKDSRPVISLEKFKQDLVSAVRPVLPAESFNSGQAFPISFQILQPPAQIKTKPLWQTQLRNFGVRHWPSFAVLGIGLILLTIMMQGQPDPVSDNDEGDDEVILSIDSAKVEAAAQQEAAAIPEIAIAQPEDYARREAEQRLHKMVDKDPDSAAKVIESWIRNAG